MLLLSMIDLSSSVYDVIKIPVYLPDINGNYAAVDLVIRFNNNQKSKENTIIEFCKKHSVDVVGCNSIKEQAFKTIADVEKNMLQSYIDKHNQNGLISIPIKYETPDGLVKELRFEVREDDPFIELLLSSFCIKHLIDDDSCTEIFKKVKKSITTATTTKTAATTTTTSSSTSRSSVATSSSSTSRSSVATSSSTPVKTKDIIDDQDFFEKDKHTTSSNNFSSLSSTSISLQSSSGSLLRSSSTYNIITQTIRKGEISNNILRIPIIIKALSSTEAVRSESFEIRIDEPLVDVIVSVFCESYKIERKVCEMLYKYVLVMIYNYHSFRSSDVDDYDSISIRTLKDVKFSIQTLATSIISSSSYDVYEHYQVINNEIQLLYHNFNRDSIDERNNLLIKEKQVLKQLTTDPEVMFAKRICIISNFFIKSIYELEDILLHLRYSGLYIELDALIVLNYGHEISSKIKNKHEKIQWVQMSSKFSYFDIPSIRIIHELSRFWNQSSQINTQVLYMHSLGSTYMDRYQSIDDWRHMLFYFHIEKHLSSYHLLESDELDCIGVNLIDQPSKHFDGNYWWSTSTYLTQLPTLQYSSTGRHEVSQWLLQLPQVRIFTLHSNSINHHINRYPRRCYSSTKSILPSKLDNNDHISDDDDGHDGSHDFVDDFCGGGAVKGELTLDFNIIDLLI